MIKLNRKLAALLVGAACAFATPAQADPYLSITGPSGIFGDGNVTCEGMTPCEFTRTFSFLTPEGYNLTSVDILSNFTGDNTTANIDFSEVTLNGVDFNVILTGQQEFRNLLNQSIVPGGDNTIFVRGTSGGNAAFNGTISFASVAAVPEPGTWAMMLLGFGFAGYGMRRRNRTNLLPQAA